MKSGERQRSGRSAGRRRFAFCLLAAALPGFLQISGASAETRDAVAVESRRMAFAIPAQDLNTAVLNFADRTGLQVFYDAQRLDGLRSGGVRGDHSVAEALSRLLAGTGLTYRFTAADAVTLEAAPKADDGDASGPLRLQGITVTAEKVERDYIETYSSVGIADGEDIEIYNVLDLHDVFENMANVRAFPANNGNNAFQIRGLNADGISQPANSSPLVSVIIDGVTQSAEGLKRGSRGTWDVDRVSVLRGPQSTLQGRNALGGAVVVETRDPTYYTERVIEGALGNQQLKRGAFALSGALVEDQVAARLSGEYHEETREVTFADPANDPLKEDKFRSFRGKLLIEPRDYPDLRILLNASHVFDQPTAPLVSAPDFFARQNNNAATFTEFRQMNVGNVGADVSYEDGALTYRSITGGNLTNLSIDSAPGNVGFFRSDDRQDQDFMQELRVEIDENASGLTGVAGLFFGDFDQEVDSFIDAGGVVFQDGTFINQTTTMAAYTDLRFDVLDSVTLIGGLRIQRDTVRNFIDNASAFGNTFTDRDAEFLVFLPKGGVAFRLTDNQTLAATATRGYRQGFTEVLAGTANTTLEVEPEFVWTYELAYRLSGVDRRLQLGANLFYNRFQNQQVTVTSLVAPPLANTQGADGSFSYGAELEGSYDFANGFRAFGALGLLKTELGDFPDVGCAASGGNCAGNEFPEAPNVTMALGGAYHGPDGFFASATATYTGSYFTQGDVNNLQRFKVDGRFLANARLGWEGENVYGSLFVSNIFDRDYLTGISTAGNEASIADGRTFGLELGVRF